MTLLPRPTRSAVGAASIGAVAPLLLAAQGPAGLPPEVSQALPWWAVLLISAASPACAWGVSVLVGGTMHAAGAWLKARGHAKLEDKDPSNDAAGRAELAAGEELERRAEKIDQGPRP